MPDSSYSNSEAALLDEFHWLIYVFGAFLIFTGFRMGLQQNEEVQPEHNPVFKLFRRLMPITERFEGDKFFIRRGGTLMATPLPDPADRGEHGFGLRG